MALAGAPQPLGKGVASTQLYLGASKCRELAHICTLITLKETCHTNMVSQSPISRITSSPFF